MGDVRLLAARAPLRSANLKRTHDIVAAQRGEEFALPPIDVVVEDRGKQRLVARAPLLDRHGQGLRDRAGNRFRTPGSSGSWAATYSLATRFMPSRNGVTRPTRAVR